MMGINNICFHSENLDCWDEPYTYLDVCVDVFLDEWDETCKITAKKASRNGKYMQKSSRSKDKKGGNNKNTKQSTNPSSREGEETTESDGEWRTDRGTDWAHGREQVDNTNWRGLGSGNGSKRLTGTASSPRANRLTEKLGSSTKPAHQSHVHTQRKKEHHESQSMMQRQKKSTDHNSKLRRLSPSS